ncbi:MAG: hypothetical protein FWH33_02345 [Oscillospiraceae bacterium]|nr:hypothetical protein [Oscillospiraceae bacterium]
MTIEARFNSHDLIGKLRDGAYDLPDGATVAAFMEAAQREAGIELSEQQMESFVFVFNNSPAAYDTVLSGGGKLRVMFKLLGG